MHKPGSWPGMRAPRQMHATLRCCAAQNLLLSEDIYCVPGLLPAIGRLANAMVAVLGPEYTLGSSAYLTCKGIINDMQSLERGTAGVGWGCSRLRWWLAAQVGSPSLGRP